MKNERHFLAWNAVEEGISLNSQDATIAELYGRVRQIHVHAEKGMNNFVRAHLQSDIRLRRGSLFKSIRHAFAIF